MGEARRISYSKAAAHAVVVGAFVAAGCGGRKPAPSCEWTATSQPTTLIDEVRRAEDIAIRYADGRGYREGWRQTRENCEATLFADIAASRGLALEAVLSARAQLASRAFDWAVNLPIAVLAIAMSWLLCRRILRRFHGEPIPLFIAVVLVSAVFAAGIVAVGQLWAAAVETLRIGNGHLSYRAARIPWAGHRLETFILAALTMWIAAVARLHGTRHRHAGTRS